MSVLLGCSEEKASWMHVTLKKINKKINVKSLSLPQGAVPDRYQIKAGKREHWVVQLP